MASQPDISTPKRRATRLEQGVKVVVVLSTILMSIVGVVFAVAALLDSRFGFFIELVGAGLGLIWVTLGAAYLFAGAKLDDRHRPCDFKRLHWIPWIGFVVSIWAVGLTTTDQAARWFFPGDLFDIADAYGVTLTLLLLSTFVFFTVGKVGSRIVLEKLRRNIREHRLCFQCGYDLSYQTDDWDFQCPECGEIQPEWWRDGTAL